MSTSVLALSAVLWFLVWVMLRRPPAPVVEHAVPDFFDVGDGNDWRRLPFEITKAVEDPAGPGVIVEQLTPGLGLAIDPATDEAVILEQGSGELVRFPMFRLRDIDPVMLVEALDDPVATEAAARGDLLVESKPNDTWVKAWVRGDEGRHWGVHRSLAVPGWPWAEE